MVVLMLGYFLAPLFLIIPLMVAAIVGAESFVGEKERHTLEGLLYTPATDLELYAGKVLAGAVPAVIAAFLNFGIYAVVVNLVTAPIVGGIWFPTVSALALAVWVGPAVALLGVSASVLVSTRVETFLEANQLTGPALARDRRADGRAGIGPAPALAPGPVPRRARLLRRRRRPDPARRRDLLARPAHGSGLTIRVETELFSIT